MQQAESIDEALVQETGHPLPLFGQEAAVGGIAHRVVNVYRLVADVIVPAQNQLGTGAQQFHRIVPEVFQPLHLKGLALVAACSRRVIDAHHGQVAVIGTDKPPFAIVLLHAHAVFHMVRLAFRQDGDSAIPFLPG